MTRTTAALLLLLGTPPTSPAQGGRSDTSRTVRMVVHADLGKYTISRNIYGHFAEHLGRDIYDGFWARDKAGQWHLREDIIAALKKIKAPTIRWPGGCFAEYYHWKDGIGPRDKRPTIVNTVWGDVTEDNSFGTHEYMELVNRLGAEPFVVGDVHSGSVQEMAQWWEYMNAPGESPMADLRRSNGREGAWNVKYWGIGNESWGCGGNMKPEYYADLFKRYATVLHQEGGTRPFLIATGPIADHYTWTDAVMRDAGGMIDGLDWHHYIWSQGSATNFGEREWFSAMQSAVRTEDILVKQAQVMDKYDPQKRVALIVGEWGMWHDVEPGTNPNFLYQQNTMRDALVAAVSLNIFSRHADRVRMATIAQTVNVLQAMILTRGDEMIVTPTYDVFDLYAVHHDATLLPMTFDGGRYEYGAMSVPAVSATASRDKEGKIHLTLANVDPNQPRTVRTEVQGADVATVAGRILTADAMNAHNTFEQPAAVRITPFEGAKLEGNTVSIELPAKSVVMVELVPKFSSAVTARGDSGKRRVSGELVLEFTSSSGTIQDKNGRGTGFTTRLPGSASDLALKDANLLLDTAQGVLRISTTTADINGQRNMPDLEAVGVRLSALGFTGSEDFTVTGTFVNIPDNSVLDTPDQLGIFVGTSTRSLVRAGFINFDEYAPPGVTRFNKGFSVLTNGRDDSNPNFAGKDVGETMTVEIGRRGGTWSVLVNGANVMPNTENNASGTGVPPAFLNGQPDMIVGVFALDVNGTHKQLQVDRFAVSVAPQH